MKTILIGKNGYIAKAYLKKHPEAIPTTSIEDGESKLLDLETFNPSMLEWADPESVILLMAGISSPDICSKHYDKAYAINVKGVSSLIRTALSKGIKVIFFSSDTVYGENIDTVDETSNCHPVGDYGRMKYEVEQTFLGEPNFKTLRLSYVFSKEDKFTKYLLESKANNKAIQVFEPFDRSIVYLQDVLTCIDKVIENWNQTNNIINVCGPETISRSDFVKTLCQTSTLKGLAYEIVIPEEAFFLNRPKTIKMRSAWMEKLLKSDWHTFQEAVKIEFN